MNELRYTLLSDGPSDRALLPLFTWLLREHGVTLAIQPAWADLRRMPRPPRRLAERIQLSIALYPCDRLFVHRDAEREPHAARVDELRRALDRASGVVGELPPAVSVVPVRMQEAWLLFDESAIRSAAGNPRGRHPLQLPRSADVESLPDPKTTLHALLKSASGLSGRRLAGFSPTQAAARIADLIDDYSPLRSLSAFRCLEAELSHMIYQYGWHS